MDGSKLASGRARGASFQTGVQVGVEADLKLLAPSDFQYKYGVDEIDYQNVIERWREGCQLPDWKPVMAKIPAGLGYTPEPMEYRPMPIQEQAKPTVQYRAKAFGENIIVQRVEKEHSSNIIIPDNALAKSDNGYVISVGERVQNLKPGQLVMFDQFAAHGNEMKLVDDEGIERENLLLKECDVLCLLEKVQSSD